MLRIDGVEDLDDQNTLNDWFDAVVRVARRVSRQLGGVPTRAVFHDPAGWPTWVTGLRALRTLHRGRGGIVSRRSRMLPVPTANRLFQTLIRGCRPGPITLPKSRRVVMPNNFSLRTATVAPDSPADWAALGIDPGAVTPAARVVRAFWVLAFATFAVPPIPVCGACEAKLPPTKKKKPSRKALCRACEQRNYFKGRMVRDPAGMRQVWRDIKRRERG